MFFFIKGIFEIKFKLIFLNKFDIKGLVFLVIMFFSLNILIIKGLELGVSLFFFIILLVIIIGFFSLFIVFEKCVINFLIDFKLFKNKVYIGVIVLNFLLNGVVGILIVVNIFV